MRNPFRRRVPKLTGWPQLVEFRGVPMRIVQAEQRFDSGDVTVRLVDEAKFQRENRR